MVFNKPVVSPQVVPRSTSLTAVGAGEGGAAGRTPSTDDVVLSIDPNVSVHVVAAVLRRCFQEMPETVLTNALYTEFVPDHAVEPLDHERVAK